jgi:hypothetical protein
VAMQYRGRTSAPTRPYSPNTFRKVRMYATKAAAMLAALSAAVITPGVDWCVRDVSTSGGGKLFYIVPCSGPDYGEGALYDTLMYIDESCISEEVVQV